MEIPDERVVDCCNAVSEKIIGAAIEVHRHFGPGLLESAYEAFLCREMTLRGLEVRSQVPLPVNYKGVRVECGYRVDILVNGLIIIELKAVERLEPIHEAQLLTYLKLSNLYLGLLFNFREELLKTGINRVINFKAGNNLNQIP
ncbi:MAG TPA: GxxExxY protein [Abditibacterium sp.]|jgi:GxxExxY protein